MNPVLKIFRFQFEIILFSIFVLITGYVSAQDADSAYQRDSLISAAREYMRAARFCSLVTIDSTGNPHVRTMDPFEPDENMVIWLGTNRNSRKVREILNNPKVNLFYTQNKGFGYVSITGIAKLVDDKAKKSVLWKDEWKNFYDQQKENYILIKVIPERLELLNYKKGITGNKRSWKTPAVDFNY
jgi:general stress protein 26